MNLHGKKSFANNSVNEKVNMFNTSIKNILSNYIPHETITFEKIKISNN